MGHLRVRTCQTAALISSLNPAGVQHPPLMPVCLCCRCSLSVMLWQVFCKVNMPPLLFSVLKAFSAVVLALESRIFLNGRWRSMDLGGRWRCRIRGLLQGALPHRSRKHRSRTVASPQPLCRTTSGSRWGAVPAASIALSMTTTLSCSLKQPCVCLALKQPCVCLAFCGPFLSPVRGVSTSQVGPLLCRQGCLVQGEDLGPQNLHAVRAS